MGLFFEVLSAINNPNQQGNIDQLASVANTVQQLATDRGIEPSTLGTVMSSLGGVLRPVLQQQAGGGNLLQSLIGQVTGGALGGDALQSLLTPELQQQAIGAIAQKTNLPTDQIQSMLPSLLPALMNLLQMGNPAAGGQGTNSVLSAFLDGDKDGDLDLGDAMNFANRFLNPPS